MRQRGPLAPAPGPLPSNNKATGVVRSRSRKCYNRSKNRVVVRCGDSHCLPPWLERGIRVSAFSNDEVEEAKRLAKDLADLRQLSEQVNQDLASNYFSASIEDRIEKWLLKLQEIAKAYKAVDYTITLGVPLGVSVSFTWSPKG